MIDRPRGTHGEPDADSTPLATGACRRCRRPRPRRLASAFEIPITSEKDLMDWRVNTDFVIHL
jgi:hypothetical protein